MMGVYSKVLLDTPARRDHYIEPEDCAIPALMASFAFGVS